MTMTRPELARYVSTTPRDISDIETGKKTPPANYVKLVTEILGLDPEDVFVTLSKQYPEYELSRIAQPRYGAQNA